MKPRSGSRTRETSYCSGDFRVKDRGEGRGRNKYGERGGRCTHAFHGRRRMAIGPPHPFNIGMEHVGFFTDQTGGGFHGPRFSCSFFYGVDAALLSQPFYVLLCVANDAQAKATLEPSQDKG